MPIYEYISESPGEKGKSCRNCSKGFELFRPLSREPLVACPTCRNAVKKLISAVSKPNAARGFSISEAKAKGFQVLKRQDKGTYEKM